MVPKPSYRARLATYLIPIGLFAVVSTVAVLLVRGYSFDFASGGLRKAGLIVLDSSPNNAYITINGALRPERTRATLKLTPGTYDVKVDMPGVHPWQEQIRLEPGQAVLDENILLFRTVPQRTDLTQTAVPGQALAPSGKALAWLGPGSSNVSLSVSQTGRTANARTVGDLPIAYAAPRLLGWSGDGSRLVVSAGDETRIVAVADGRTVTVPIGGRAAVAPGQPDAVIVEPTPGRLVRASAGTPQSVEPYESDVTAWTVAGNLLYAARSDGTLVKHGGGNDRHVISQGHPLVELAAAPETDRVFGRAADGTVYLVGGSGLEQIATGAERFTVSRDGNQVVYLRQRELRLWNRTDGTDALLTRFTAVPEQLAVIPGGHYVLYGRSGELHAIAADGRNDTQLATGVDLSEVIDREHVLVRDRTSGRTTALTILNR